MSYTIKQQVFSASSNSQEQANLLSKNIMAWLNNEFEEFELIGTSALSYKGEHGGLRFYTYYSSNGYGIAFCPVRSLTESSYTDLSYTVSMNLKDYYVASTGEYSIGITVIRTDSCILLLYSNRSFTLFYSYVHYMGYVNSYIKGKYFFVSTIYGTTSLTISLAPSGGDTFYNSVINVILPSSLASEAANGDLIASPVYVSTSSIWIEPMRLPALYELYGRTYPEVLQIVNLGGTNLIKIPNYFAIG